MLMWMPLLTGKLPWMGKLFQKLEIDLNGI